MPKWRSALKDSHNSGILFRQTAASASSLQERTGGNGKRSSRSKAWGFPYFALIIGKSPRFARLTQRVFPGEISVLVDRFQCRKLMPGFPGLFSTIHTFKNCLNKKGNPVFLRLRQRDV